MRDIESKNDIVLFADDFYQRLLADDRIAHHFADLDIANHMPRIYGFWNMILFGDQEYKTNMMMAHQHLKFAEEDFKVWTRHFEAAVRANFEGDRADEAMSRASVIALTMRYKFIPN